jgi:hypothetical protein
MTEEKKLERTLQLSREEEKAKWVGLWEAIEVSQSPRRRQGLHLKRERRPSLLHRPRPACGDLLRCSSSSMTRRNSRPPPWPWHYPIIFFF